MNILQYYRLFFLAKPLWLAVLVMILSTRCALSVPKDQTVVLKPGQNIQEIVSGSPEGTRFRFEPGIYREQTIYPKSRQELIGQDGAILSGAIVLRAWTKQNGFWHTQDKLPEPLRSSEDVCASGRALCHLREDLFLNDRLYERVGSLDDLGPGKWYYESRRAYLADDPSGQSVELGVTPLAIGGNAVNVVVRNLVVEKYASLAQGAAIDFSNGRGWTVSDVTAHWNHGVGLTFGSETHVEGGSFSHNGQVGMKGTGEGSTVEGVEIAYNNYAGYSTDWEAGGTKFYRSRGLVVRNSCIHHNVGPGLWSDIDNIDLVYEHNKVFSNKGDGIKHEISYDADIHDNVVAYNGKDFDPWLWGSQILVQNSRNVNVYGNLVEVLGDGHGIGVIHQDRGEGRYGPRYAINNRINNNTIVYLDQHGQSGVVMDTEEDWFWRNSDNQFDRNKYVVVDATGKYWTFDDRDETWDDVRNRGHERNGTLSIEQRAPLELSCDR